MFLHCFKYAFKMLLKTKVLVFWTMLFPIILGTLFNAVFSNIYESETLFREVPVAVVGADDNSAFKAVLDGIEKDGTKLFTISYTDEQEALDMLRDGDIKGIIYSDDLAPELTVNTTGVDVSIIKSFLDRYKSMAGVISDVAVSSPEKLGDTIESLEKQIAPLTAAEYTDGNTDPYVTYFYNLLAMTALFASLSGMYICIVNQANLSDSGARLNISTAGQRLRITSWLIAFYIFQYIGIMIASAYLYFVLKIDFGVSFGLTALINLLSVACGLSLGFFIGAIGTISENTKRGILLAVTLGLSFFSGLMIGGISMLVEEYCPIFNRINPARLIADCFYSVNIYGIGDRFERNMITIAVWTVLLMAGGLILSRRKKYKSL
ncbi:MAG: ABC transporter permease [Ruminococcus sp.]